MIGPMRGEMSIAPMITAVELRFKPRQAMKIAKMSTQRFAPRKVTPSLICSTMAVSSVLSGKALKNRLAIRQT